MADERAQPGGSAAGASGRAAGPGIGRTVIDDFRRGDLHRKMRQDFRDLYDFYIDEDRKIRLARMGRVQRAFHVVFWLAKSMFLKLSPARRILLLIAVVVFVNGNLSIPEPDPARGEHVRLLVDLHLVSLALLLVILMLELKDKLLAHDELKTGRAVQLALLPAGSPELAGWEIRLFTRPANEVGGDLVDFIPLADGRLGVMLGDVAGKGLGAALLMAKLQATLRALAPESSSLSDLGARINKIICRDGLSNRFATLVYAELAPEAGAVRLVNAGHLPPVVVRASGPSRLPVVALPIGVRPDEIYVEQGVDLAAGEAFLVYSDGLSEARNARGEFFGDQRLEQVLPQLRGLSADSVAERLVAEVGTFVGDERLADDLSILVVRRSVNPTV